MMRELRSVAMTPILLLAACAHQRDPYADALSAVRSLGADVDGHVRLEPYSGTNPNTQRVNNTWVVRLPRGYLTTVAAGYGYAAAVGVVAHELAHLPGVRLGVDATPGTEAYADAVAGCALARLALDVGGYESLVYTHSPNRAKVARVAHDKCLNQFGGHNP